MWVLPSSEMIHFGAYIITTEVTHLGWTPLRLDRNLFLKRTKNTLRLDTHLGWTTRKNALKIALKRWKNEVLEKKSWKFDEFWEVQNFHLGWTHT